MVLNKQNPFMGILRGLPLAQVHACAEACATSHLECIEIPLNTPQVAQVLSSLRIACQNYGVAVGAGTVRTEQDLELALDSGAQFIVSPNTFAPVIHQCVARGVPCFPGALTPSEIQQAFAWGASAVKVFPIGAMGGVSYIKELRGPFGDITLLACGGVQESNAKAYLAAGCDFLAFGGSIFKPSLMESGQWESISQSILALRRAAGFV